MGFLYDESSDEIDHYNPDNEIESDTDEYDDLKKEYEKEQKSIVILIVYLQIQIKNKKNIATITGIQADYGCYDNNKKKIKGSELLYLAIEFISTKRNFKTGNGEILKIKKIHLTDNSHITCDNKK